jgi:hypothetical protein
MDFFYGFLKKAWQEVKSRSFSVALQNKQNPEEDLILSLSHQATFQKAA